MVLLLLMVVILVNTSGLMHVVWERQLTAMISFVPILVHVALTADSSDTYVPELVGSDYYCESGLYSTQIYNKGGFLTFNLLKMATHSKW